MTVETEETTQEVQTNQSNQSEKSDKTENNQETSTWLNAMNDTKIVGGHGEELTHATSEEETEQTNETENAEENTDEEGQTNEQEEVYKVLKIKVNGKEEEFDLADEKQRTKAIEYMQKGRHTESIHEAKTEFEKQKDLANQEFNKLTYVYLMNVNDGKIQVEEPKRSDYFDPDGKYYARFQYEEDADKAYKEAVSTYDSTMRSLSEYRSKASKSYEDYKQTLAGFQSKHPEVTDMAQFIKDHVNPRIQPLLSMGAEPLPSDLLEAIYTHTYLDEIIKDAIEKDRKKLSKEGGKKTATSVKVDEKRIPPPLFGKKDVTIRFR